METLDSDLVLDPAGHLTDLGATALVDGQSGLLSDAVQQHAATCPECALRLGEAALRSLEVHDWVASGLAPVAALAGVLVETRAHEPAGPPPFAAASELTAAGAREPTARLPRWALLGAAATALLGLSLATSAAETATLALSVARALPLLLRTLLAGLQTPGLTPRLERAAWAGATALWVTGLILGWLATRGRQGRQGERS